jgi:hypothetical protein
MGRFDGVGWQFYWEGLRMHAWAKICTRGWLCWGCMLWQVQYVHWARRWEICSEGLPVLCLVPS